MPTENMAQFEYHEKLVPTLWWLLFPELFWIAKDQDL